MSRNKKGFAISYGMAIIIGILGAILVLMVALGIIDSIFGTNIAFINLPGS